MVNNKIVQSLEALAQEKKFEEQFKIATSVRNRQEAKKFMQTHGTAKFQRDFDKAMNQRFAEQKPGAVVVVPTPSQVVVVSNNPQVEVPVAKVCEEAFFE